VADSEGQHSSGSQGRAVPLRDGLVVVLALTAGAVNAVTFVRLGQVFSSVITGNLALLGIAAGQRSGSLAVNGSLALAGYAVGVLAGARLARAVRSDERVWPLRTTVTLVAELVVLAGFSAGWLAADGHPAGGARLTLLVVAAMAMGMQSTAMRHLGQVSSTYLTSTLIGILEASASGSLPASWKRSLGAVLALAVGAVPGAAAATDAPSLVPVIVLIPVAAVVACSAWSASLRQPRNAGRREGGPQGGTAKVPERQEAPRVPEPQDPPEVLESQDPPETPEPQDPLKVPEPREAPEVPEPEEVPEAQEPQEVPEAQEPEEVPGAPEPEEVPEAQEPEEVPEAQEPQEVPNAQERQESGGDVPLT
jgi:uncharacterized membrane protein YoaK (UPF0700 family)